LQAFIDSLAGLGDATQAWIISAVKSLFAFGHRLGYLPYNVGAPIVVPTVRNRLSERILTESEVIAMIALEKNPRDRAMLRLFYLAGLRVSELVAVKWEDLSPRENGEAQVSVFGKGRKTRVILLPKSLWSELVALRGEKLTGPVFPGRHFKSDGSDSPRRQLTTSQAWRIVKRAAQRAGIPRNVSPHWMRHAHASHALDRGCPVHLLSECLGHASLSTTSRYAHSRPGEGSSKYLSS
jgi:integrase/recombinase XerD